MKIKTLILGAGIAGLSYANEINEENSLIIEKNEHIGGLCHSFTVDGFTFDSAVHLSFTTNEEVRTVFDKTDYLKHLPISYNYYKNRWLKHPVVNNFFELTTEEKVGFISQFVNRDENREIHNYEDWLRASYGDAITEEFYNVYTEKYWTMPSKELSTTWIGSRLGTPNLEKMLLGAFSKETGIDYYAKEMRYPSQGGYQSFINSLADAQNIVLGNKVVSLDLEEKSVILEDGTRYEYEYLATSIPLPELVSITKNVPSDVVNAVKDLKASKISIVSVGIKKENVSPCMWFYIYDRDMFTARVNSPSIKSPQNVPNGCSSLQFEIYHNPSEEIDVDKIVENVRYSISKMNLCEDEDILFMDYKLLDYGNVIFDIGMEEKREIVRNYYESYDIDLIGRFGEWEYLWSDQSFMSGKNKAKKRKEKM